MTKIAVSGAAGRMGVRILTLASRDKNFEIVGALEASGHPAVGQTVGKLIGSEAIRVPVVSEAKRAFEPAEVIIDFTAPAATAVHVEEAVQLGRPMVIGTTGLNEKEREKVRSAAQKIAVVMAPNMSVGVNLLFQLVERAASILGEDYDAEIVEVHHKHKKDAPSGTALELARRIARAREVDLESIILYGRQGQTGERKQGTIGVHAVRGGDVVGDHAVSFLTDGEQLELVHRATSRDAFAKGALVAAQFVVQKKSGFFTMQDVLGL